MPNARILDPSTSHQAARSVTNVTQTQHAILEIYRQFRNGLTDYELVTIYQREARAYDYPQASESGIRSRRAELVDQGRVEDTGKRVKLPSGRSAIVWVATC